MFLISRGGGLVGVVMRTYYASALRSIPGVKQGSGGCTMVGLAVEEIDVEFLGQ